MYLEIIRLIHPMLEQINIIMSKVETLCVQNMETGIL